MDFISPTAYQFTSVNGVTNQNLAHIKPSNTWTVIVARLRHEKEILEIGLANCVTYLNALRRRQARNVRLLSVDPLPPRRKRKRIQQSKRELDREIRNRQRDEQAFLNNIQACNANLYVAEASPFTPTDFSTTSTDYTSSTTQCSIEESEPTEISWTGWTDDVVVSPFGKKCSKPFVVDVAPDELFNPEYDVIAVRDLGRPPPLMRDMEDADVPPVGPNTPRSQHWHSPLSPAAAAFEPTRNIAFHDTDSTGKPTQTPSTLPTGSGLEIEATSARRVTAAAICRTLQQLSIEAQPEDAYEFHDTLLNTALHCGTTKTINAAPNRRSRANSL